MANAINTVPGITPATATDAAHTNACGFEIHICHLVYSNYNGTLLNLPGFKLSLI